MKVLPLTPEVGQKQLLHVLPTAGNIVTSFYFLLQFFAYFFFLLLNNHNHHHHHHHHHLKRKIFSVETILSAYIRTHRHRGTSTHNHSDHTKLKIHSLSLGDLEWMKTSARNRKHGRSTILGKEMFLDYI